MDDSPIGLIGMGLLGSALAERMLEQGLVVLGYDVTAACCQRLRDLGGSTATTGPEVLAQCERVVLCVPDSTVVRQVIDEGVHELRPGHLLIDSTTGDPGSSEAVQADLAARGIGYVAATIAGSSEQVRRGEAVVIVGGSDADQRRALTVLAAWSQRRFSLASAAASARMKLVVNLVLGLNRAVLAEGLSLAGACGIEPALALEILKATPAFSAVMNSKGPKMVARDYTPQARLAQHLKDVRLIRQLAAQHSAPTPLSEVHEQLLSRACDLGFAEADNAAILEAF
jgi:3-hydroxyisobutyrate dehydrogenase-like beta-hydroxyacid dehydrogenase